MKKKDIHQVNTVFAERILELGNLIVIALVFSQMLSDYFNKVVAGTGVIFYVLLSYLAYFLLKENKNAIWSTPSSYDHDLRCDC